LLPQWFCLVYKTLRFVGSLKLQVSFAKEPYKREDILQWFWFCLVYHTTRLELTLTKKILFLVKIFFERLKLPDMTDSRIGQFDKRVDILENSPTKETMFCKRDVCFIPHNTTRADFDKKRELPDMGDILQSQPLLLNVQ